jgi:undecaprenyl diphosphate synthase
VDLGLGGRGRRRGGRRGLLRERALLRQVEADDEAGRGLEEAAARTAGGTRLHLRVAVDYSSRAAIHEAFALGEGIGSTRPGTNILPPVDLVLRTGGERRLSDFLLWESAYAELAFLDVNFPDLSIADLDAVFADYASRERRYGAVPVQVTG